MERYRAILLRQVNLWLSNGDRTHTNHRQVTHWFIWLVWFFWFLCFQRFVPVISHTLYVITYGSPRKGIVISPKETGILYASACSTAALISNRAMWHTRKTFQQDTHAGVCCLSDSSGLSGLTKQENPNNGLLLLAGFFSVLLKKGRP